MIQDDHADILSSSTACRSLQAGEAGSLPEREQACAVMREQPCSGGGEPSFGVTASMKAAPHVEAREQVHRAVARRDLEHLAARFRGITGEGIERAALCREGEGHRPELGEPVVWT